MASITFVKGVNQGTSVPLEGDKIVLGRNADCQVVLNVPAVSREHAVIRRIQGKFYIEDMKSRNGTFVNKQEVTGRTLLKDNDEIKICDNLLSFVESTAKKPLPEYMGGTLIHAPAAEEEDESSSTVEATISQSSKQILETQPAEKLAFLLNMTADLTQTFNIEELLPKIVDSLFQVFRQADRGFVILADDDKLIPKVIKARRGNDDASARFSRRIVNKCLETGDSLLSEDASADKRFDLSQSIADCRIRSVMCAPLNGRNSSGKPLGVIQLDTQDRFKKFTQDDLKLLVAVAGQSAVALENAKMHESLLARAGLERDLKLAQQVQLSFLPKKPPQLAGYEFFAHYESAQEVGGDYYDFIPLPASRLGVMVGDVAGKGVSAALLMAKVSSDARFCMLTESNPADAVFKLNELMQEAGHVDKFVTLGAGLLDSANHRVTFVNAGHMSPLLYRKATGKVEEAMGRDQGGFPLGVADGIPFEACTVDLEPGDVVVLFTDGVTDAKNKQDVDFQMDGIFAALNTGPMTPKTVGQRLITAVRQHAQGCKQHDDITVVCFGRMQ